MGAVENLRPFLAPFYAWINSVPKGACLPIPAMLRLTMTFLEGQLSNGHLMCKCEASVDDAKPTVSFYTDAMAEHGKAAMGGWQEHP
eukprot:4618766-Karenia_brevis.AAC.1